MKFVISLKMVIGTITVIALMFPTIIHAQPDLGGDDVNDVPIDGGLSLLVAAGVGYGIKKMRKKVAGSE